MAQETQKTVAAWCEETFGAAVNDRRGRRRLRELPLVSEQSRRGGRRASRPGEQYGSAAQGSREMGVRLQGVLTNG